MFDSIHRISVLNRVFNVKGDEWSRIALAWMIRLFYRFGFVVGWTVLVAMFVIRYGIASLPYLFILTAVFTIIGSLFYSVILEKFKRTTVMVVTICLAALVLFAATCFVKSNEVLFFALVITAVSVFLMQLRMILTGYVEDMFNPLESERTFPLIEASDTVGGIFAGMAVVFLSSGIEAFQFVYLWIAALILIIPLVLLYEFVYSKVEHISDKKRSEYIGVYDKLKTQLASNPKQWQYVKGLFLIVFFQWILFNLLEFQYTSAVYDNIAGVVMDAGSGFEHAFVHDLGELFILFSASALMVQFFIGSRLINYLGVVGSMLLHGIVTFLSLLGFTIVPNFYTAILAKNNFTITTVIHTNAYHSSYYAVKEGIRGQVRELLEGVVRPIGAIVGTLALIGAQALFQGQSLMFVVNFLMIFTVILSFIVTYRQQDKYTEVALEDLHFGDDKHVRFNAIDILSQKGHKISLEHLRNILNDENEPASVRVKVLKAFGELKSFDVIEDAIECFNSPIFALRQAALESLLSFKNLKSGSNKHVLLRHKLISALKDLYKRETDSIALITIIQVMSQLSVVSTAEFLFDVLAHGAPSDRAEAIVALGHYDDDDVYLLLKPYLKSKIAYERINAAIALFKCKTMRDESLHIISSFLFSKQKNKVGHALFAIGELKLKAKKSFCLHYISSDDVFLKMHAAIALAKMGYLKSVPVLVDLIFSDNLEIAEKTKFLARKIDPVIASNLRKIVQHIVSQRVQTVTLSCEDVNTLEAKTLRELRWCYNLVDEYEEMENIDGIINMKTI